MPAIWHAPTTTNAERKQALRFLVKDVTLARKEQAVHIAIRWQTNAVTTFEIPHPKKGYAAQRTAAAVVDRVRELAPTHSDRQIAEILNEEELTTGVGEPFTRLSAHWVRYSNHIPTGCPEVPTACPGGHWGDGRYSTRAVAELLNVSRFSVAKWCKAGRLDAIQEGRLGPYWIRLTPGIIAELRKPAS